jgi:4-amino-4-deoxy-L-arabinose transferase-like glycosyltransferase
VTVAQRRWLVAIVAVAGAVRLGWAIYAAGEPPTSAFGAGDQFSYFHYGKEIAHGHGYVSYLTGEPTGYYPIGYPFTLAVLFWTALHTPITDDLVLVASIFHALVSTATVLLTFVVARRLFGVLTGLVAAGALALWPNVVFQVTTLQLETTFVFLAMAALAIITTHDWASGPPSRDRLIAFGIVLGFTVLVRPFAAPFVIGVFLAVLATGVGAKRALLAAAVPAAVVVAMSIPWTVRNLVELDAFVPSSTNMGDTLCLDRSLETWKGFRFADHEWCVDPTTPEVERNRGNTRKAIEFVLEHPDEELRKIPIRAWYMFRESHDGLDGSIDLHGPDELSERRRDALRTASDGTFFVMLALSILGLPLLLRRGGATPERRIVLVAVVSLLAIPLLLWGNPRFHVPLLPFMAILAAAVIVTSARWVHRRVAGRPPG